MIVYCRAVDTAAAAEFPAVAAAIAAQPEAPELLYVWADLTVTATPFPDDDVLITGDAEPQWARFCADRLGITGPPAGIVVG